MALGDARIRQTPPSGTARSALDIPVSLSHCWQTYNDPAPLGDRAPFSSGQGDTRGD